jgi:hypothetical protein
MEKVLEKTARKPSEKTLERMAEEATCIGIEFDENGEPIGCCTHEEVFDRLDQKFVDFYGEEGRRMVNARRERWNRKGPWHYKLF